MGWGLALHFVIAGHSRPKDGVAELVIGPATSGSTRWLAYDPAIHAAGMQSE
jgi:hypothetical protein